MPPTIVLVVEDDLHTRNIIEMVLKRDRMLRYEQLDVICAADGEEGLELFRQRKPDVMITDLLMPKMDGFALVKAVRAEDNGDLPILATSAIVRDRNTLRKLENEFDVRLQLKPFSPRALAEQVRRMLQERAQKLAPNPAGGERATEKADRRQISAPEATGTSRRGDLQRTPAAMVLLDAAEEQWTGTLELKRSKIRKLIHLQAGHPIFVQSNVRGETLGQLLVRRGGIDESQHQQVLKAVKEQQLKYGEALVRLRVMTEGQVMAELVAQTRYKVESVLRWRAGSWHFVADSSIGSKVPRCTVDPVAAVFRGLRRYPSVEEALSRVLGGKLARSEIVPLERMERYRERFAEVFGSVLLETVGDGCPLVKILHAPAIQDMAVQLDAMLRAGLVALRDGPVTGVGAVRARDKSSRRRHGRRLEAAGMQGAESQAVDVAAAGGSAAGEIGPHAPGGALTEEPAHAGDEPRALTPSSEVMALHSLVEPTAQPLPELEQVAFIRPRPIARVATDRARRVDAEQVHVARQLIDATYLGIHGRNHYEVLGVIPDTDTNGIEVAYRIKRKQFDLERFRGMDLGDAYSRLEEICSKLDEAYAVLREPDSREAYHVALRSQTAANAEVAMQAEEAYRAGCELLGQKKYAEALERLQQASQLDDQAEYLAQEALAYFLANGQTVDAGAEAMIHVQAALAADTDNPGPHLVAARVSWTLGSVVEAVQHLEAAIKLDPTHREAFAQLEQVLLQDNQIERLEEEYRRTIFLLGNSDRQWAATLWKRLFHIYRDRFGDHRKASMAGQAALKLNPSDAALRAVVDRLDGDKAQRWPEAVLGYRALLRSRPQDRNALHELFKLHRDADNIDAAFTAAAAAMLRGVAAGDELQFVDRYADNAPQLATWPLADEMWEHLRHPDEERNLTQLFEHLTPLIEEIDPLSIDEIGVEEGDERSRALSDDFSAMLTYVCKQFDMSPPRVVVKSELGKQIEAVGTTPPVLLVGGACLEGVDPPELRFRLARAMTLVRTGRRVASWRSTETLRDYIVAAIGAVPGADRIETRDNPRVNQIAQALRAKDRLLRSCADIVASMRSEADFLHLDRWREGMLRTAERAGLLLCGDIIVAGRVVADSSSRAQTDLIDFALSEAHSRLRHKLGLSIG